MKNNEAMARLLFDVYQRELHRRYVQSVVLDFDSLNDNGKDLWMAIADAAIGGTP